MSEMTQLQQAMQAAVPQTEMRMEEPLALHTSFKIGGPCEVMAFPRTIQELSALLRWAHEQEVQPAVLGSGTNVLASDAGRRGLVICTRGCLDGLEQVNDTHIRVLAGVSMARAALFAANLGLSGLEFAHGIPGSVGGGLYMNAGAYGGEIRQVAVCTEFLDQEGNCHALVGQAQGFGYRRSAFTGTSRIIVAGTFALTKANPEEIREHMQSLMARRKASQPLELPSAGSTFKRPVGGYAAALIEQAGLKGTRIGGAAVSTKHAGFVVNLGGATEADVLALIAHIQKRVLETSGISLEPEVVRL